MQHIWQKHSEAKFNTRYSTDKKQTQKSHISLTLYSNQNDFQVVFTDVIL